ncbi:MAG: DUF5666 domain-containing protein [Candidatus Moranbacteria bacterium]|nr:DUF5666 domain-containing protein [Candidatus Moranbacteria bacterium]
MNTPETNKPETKPEQKSRFCPCFSSGKSKILIVSAMILGIIILMLGSFAGGVFTGFHKAKFSCDWGKNYEMNFIGPRMGHPSPMGFMGPMMREFSGRDFRNPHGIAGTIISISDSSLIIKDRDNKENTVAVTDKTVIKSGRDDLKLSDLKIDDKIAVIGQPGNDGVMNASLIRVFPINQNNQ